MARSNLNFQRSGYIDPTTGLQKALSAIGSRLQASTDAKSKAEQFSTEQARLAQAASDTAQYRADTLGFRQKKFDTAQEYQAAQDYAAGLLTAVPTAPKAVTTVGPTPDPTKFSSDEQFKLLQGDMEDLGKGRDAIVTAMDKLTAGGKASIKVSQIPEEFGRYASTRGVKVVPTPEMANLQKSLQQVEGKLAIGTEAVNQRFAEYVKPATKTTKAKPFTVAEYTKAVKSDLLGQAKGAYGKDLTKTQTNAINKRVKELSDTYKVTVGADAKEAKRIGTLKAEKKAISDAEFENKLKLALAKNKAKPKADKGFLTAASEAGLGTADYPQLDALEQRALDKGISKAEFINLITAVNDDAGFIWDGTWTDQGLLDAIGKSIDSR